MMRRTEKHERRTANSGHKNSSKKTDKPSPSGDMRPCMNRIDTTRAGLQITENAHIKRLGLNNIDCGVLPDISSMKRNGEGITAVVQTTSHTYKQWGDLEVEREDLGTPPPPDQASA